nr:SDR family oxidoreductase [Actinomycetota bacterium]
AGLISYPPDPVYAAAKHGVIGFVRAMAPRLSGEQITVNAVCPGLTDTGMLPASGREAIARERYPLLSAADVASVVVGLLTGSGTGQALVCQPGREAVSYRFRNVPGPASGQAPPATLSKNGWV